MQLIPVTDRLIGNRQIPTVNARELHEFLQNKTRFNDWIKNRINEYEFKENVDFVGFTENLVKPQNQENKGGRPTKEYFVTLNMAKELAMVERTDKGREARQYFIACEQKLLALQATKPQPTVSTQANRQISELIRTLQETIRGQTAMIHKLVNSHARSQDLHAQTLALLEKQITRKRYRPATNEDYFTVKDLLKQGKSFAYISQATGLSQGTVYNIKHGVLILGNDGMLQKRAEPKPTTQITIS